MSPRQISFQLNLSLFISCDVYLAKRNNCLIFSCKSGDTQKDMPIRLTVTPNSPFSWSFLFNRHRIPNLPSSPLQISPRNLRTRGSALFRRTDPHCRGHCKAAPSQIVRNESDCSDSKLRGYPETQVEIATRVEVIPMKFILLQIKIILSVPHNFCRTFGFCWPCSLSAIAGSYIRRCRVGVEREQITPAWRRVRRIR